MQLLCFNTVRLTIVQFDDQMFRHVKSCFLLPHIGDNILTAVNVAKSCGMVGSDEKVIFVNATPQTAHSMPTLKFNLGDGGPTQNSVEVITQVSPAQTQTTLLPPKTICRPQA